MRAPLAGSISTHDKVAVSLIDATVAEFLERMRQELLKPDPGLALLDTDAEDLIRAAGRSLCRDTVWKIDQVKP